MKTKLELMSPETMASEAVKAVLKDGVWKPNPNPNWKRDGEGKEVLMHRGVLTDLKVAQREIRKRLVSRAGSEPIRLLTTYHILLTTYYSLLTTYYLLLTTYSYLLLTGESSRIRTYPATYYLLLTTYYSLLTTHYSLLTTH